MEDQAGREDRLEQRAREVFDASVESLDEDARLRLSQARFEAVAAAERSVLARWSVWAPLAAAAATVVVAVLLWRSPDQTSLPPATAGNGEAAAEAVELLADGEDLDIVENDLEFYQWLDATSLDASGSTG